MRFLLSGPRIRVLAAITAAIVLPGASVAQATVHGQNGRIAFRRYFNDAHTRGAIFTIRPDGSGLRQITHRGKTLLDNEPDWAPNGRWIAFDRLAPGQPHRLFKVRADGTDVTQLSHNPCVPGNCVEDLGPAWSPDGQWIAFTRFNDDIGLVAVFVMRADGTHVRQITERGGGPMWSPDGTRLAFSRTTPTGGLAIFTVRLDGTHLRRITPWSLRAGQQPDWSPDGQWILFESHQGDQDVVDNVFLVHPDGTGLHRITTSPLHIHQWGSSSFSPDGKMITVAHSPGVGAAGNADVWVMNLDGSGLRNVTRSVIFDSAPDWGSRASRRP
jgi:Tol biopolymer transport system component